jgi:biotin transport system substrate-specific component
MSMTTLVLRSAPSRAERLPRAVFQIVCAAAGAALIAGLAQFTVYLPFTPVPITGQTLGVLLVGAAYGPGLGAATVGVYLAAAVVGLPVLAPNAVGGHDTGIRVLSVSFASAGYLWGFLGAAAGVGWLSGRGWDRSIRSSVSAMFLGELVIYLCGIPWLMASLRVGVQQALALGLYPFVVGDTIKLLLASGLLPAAWALVRRFGPEAGGTG